MKFFVVCFILATLTALPWNVDCFPGFGWQRVVTKSTNGGPPTTYKEVNNNGQIERTINGRPATAEEMGDVFESNSLERGIGWGMNNPFRHGMSTNNLDIGMGMGNPFSPNDIMRV